MKKHNKINYEESEAKNTIVVDVSIGDSAKGKLCSWLMPRYDIGVKFSGGPNAGATIVHNGEKYKFNLIPVSLLFGKPGYIGSSCLVNPVKLLEEIERLKQKGVDVDNLLRISPDCHVITQAHILADIENEKDGKGVGSTKQGMSPCASDKYGRRGIKLETISAFDYYFADVSYELNRAMDNKKNILFQGSQGALLDIDHGLDYPDVSTTSVLAGAACSSCGIGPTRITNVIGVFKPYVTKVGNGVFPTLLTDQTTSDRIVEKGGEYGTVTGRKRKIGWLDIPALKYGIRINGCKELAMMKFDVIDGMDIQCCVEYEVKGGFAFDELPVCKKDIKYCKPVYKEFKNVKLDTIINFIEDHVGVKIKYVSLSPDSKQMIVR